MPTRTLLQQYEGLEDAFRNDYSYRNTGDCDYSDIVSKFFINAYVLKTVAEEKDDIVALFKINRSMAHYEMQFGKMLGGDEALVEAKRCADEIVKFIHDVQARNAAQKKIADNANVLSN